MNIYKYWFASRLIQGNSLYNQHIAAKKKILFSNLTGNVLEIGPGAGDNLPFYPSTIEWYGIEPNIFLHSVLRKRLKDHHIQGTVRSGNAELLSFKDKTFDNVVSTLVLCSIHNDKAAVYEIHRVLKNNGTYFFIEHTRSSGPFYAFTQTLTVPFWRLLADGCTPNKDIKQVLDTSPFQSITMKAFAMPIPIVSPHIMGIAVK